MNVKMTPNRLKSKLILRTSFLLLCIFVVLSCHSILVSSHRHNQDVPLTDVDSHHRNSQDISSSSNHNPDRRRRDVLPQQDISLDEDTEIASEIFRFSPQGNVNDRYAQRSPLNPRFSVEETTGNVILIEGLDYETSPQEIINIEITNINNQDKFDTVRIVVDVQDVKEAPEWQMVLFPYRGVVPTDAPNGAAIYQLVAKDPDDDGNHQVRYYLRSGGNDMFVINEETGWIITQLESGQSYIQDQEYVLSVYAVDTTDNNEMTSVRNAAIHLHGGSYPPQFTQQEYHATVEENRSSQEVIQVKAFSFKRNQGVEYQILAPQRPYHVIQPDGTILLEESVDREHMDSYVLVIEASEPVHDGLTSTTKTGNPFYCTLGCQSDEAISLVVKHYYTVYVQVEDLNDCTPDFGQATFIFRDIAEGVLPDVQIGSVSATDCDESKNGVITYTSSGPDAALFRLTDEGTIFTLAPLDYEARPDHSYAFTVEARDSGQPSLWSTAVIIIVLSNINDLGPVFQPEEYVYYVDETAPQDYSIGTVYASDADGDRIQVRIASGNDGNHFQIDASTGVIFRNTEGDRNLPNVLYVLNITAQDDGKCCSATPGRGDTDLGVIHTSYATVSIIVNDINDNVPVFEMCSSYNPSVLESATEGTSIIQVTATDKDRGENAEITYGIETNENANLPFTITPSTGEIQTNGRLDWEDKKFYEISVTATDKGTNPLTGVCRFKITVGDVNDNSPRFAFLEYRAALASNAPAQTSFLTIKAEDADESSTVEYVTHWESSQQAMYFGLTNNKLFTKISVQPLSGTTQEFIVVASEGDSEVRATVKVTISDSSNRPPTWTEATFPSLSIPEDTAVGTIIREVEATSTSEDNRVTYKIVQGQRPETNNPKLFDLENAENQRNGEVKVFDELDFETTQSFNLTLQAESSGSFSLSDFIVLNVNLEDINDNRPKFTKSVYVTAVPENRDAGTSVITVEAIDRDVTPEFREVRYSIKQQSTSDDWQHFAINDVTGQVTTTRSFDWEEKNYFLIEVEATDGMQGHTDQATIQIRIVDVNDNSPIFDQTSYPVNVAENELVGTVITTVTAVDKDKGQSNLRYLIAGGNTGGAFRADPVNGQIIIATPLDFETIESYVLQYSANDGLNVANTRIEIAVTNVNDERPEFDQLIYKVTLEENELDVPKVILTVSADDGDDDDDVIYSLEGVDDDIFEIDPDTGEISLLEPLDREEEDEWKFLVKATDEGGMEGFAEVDVIVADTNDNGPMLEPEYTGSVPENSPIGTPVMEIEAIDEDEGDLEYVVIPDPNNPLDGSGKFAINPATGEITVKMPLDREEVPEYHVKIEVSDGVNTAETTAIIALDDLNDSPPVFLDGPYSVDAEETLEVGDTILEVTAMDPDEEFKDDVVFSIVGGNPDGLFEIITDNINLVGIIKLAKPLDYETQKPPIHRLMLQVSDGENPSDTTMATVSVIDVNDEPPVFDEDQYTATIPEDAAIGDDVIRVMASDPEMGDGGLFEFDIDESSDPDGLFDIDPDTGVVTVAKELDRETMEEHEIVLLAVDKGVPPQTGTATLVVTLSDVADSDPYFLPYVAEAKENTAPPQIVVTLEAVDDDIGENRGGPPFEYNLVSTDNVAEFFTYFVNDDNTVTIFSEMTFDRESRATYEMVFEVRETLNDGVGTSTVTIEITDQNDNPHKGQIKDILVYAYEGAIPETPVGFVGVIDPDTIEDKTYTPKQNKDLDNFLIDSDTGEVIIKENTPGGVYRFDVTVADDGTYPPVVSTVIINVKDITMEAVQSSGSFRFEDVTAEEFISKPDPDKPSKLEALQEILADILPAKYENIDIFSIINIPGMERVIDVRYSAHGSPVYPASQLNAAALANLDRIADTLGVTIAQIPVDECIHEYVCESACTNVIEVSPIPTVINTPEQSLAAISSQVVPKCVCGAKVAESGPCVDGITCINGGVCTETDNGHTCQCPSGYDGPDCQQTKRSFKDGFAFFDTLQQCLETHTSIEFITTSPDGTLLYNGPMSDPINEDDPEDFILIELISGNPVLTLNLGSGVATFEIPDPSPLHDGEWHRLDVFRVGKEIEFMIDLCKTAVVSEDHSSSTSDTSSCKVKGRTPLDNRFLNVNTPLQLGGVDTSSDFKYPPELSFVGGFDGCLRNVAQDGKVYNLEKTGRFKNTETGCKRTDGNCVGDDGLPICKNGTCVANLREAYCICNPGFVGEFCDQETPAFNFPEDSYVSYELFEDGAGLGQLNEREANYQIMFRTRHPDGLIWTISNKNGYEFIILELTDGTLRGRWNLGDGEVVAHLNGTRLDDGQWHVVQFERQDNYVVIKVDGGGGVKQHESRESQYLTIDVDPNSLVVGAFVELNAGISQDFQGCMNDPRINHNYLGFDGVNDFAVATPSNSISEGCPSDACVGSPCPFPYLCLDIWRLHQCICPAGQVDAGLTCIDFNECEDKNLCKNDGICFNQQPGYECRCKNGYKGNNCEVIPAGTRVKPKLAFAWEGYLILIMCLLVILILLLMFFVYKRNRDHKQALIFTVAAEDDIRENYVNYDEEGGGEEDETGYNLPTISIPLGDTDSSKNSWHSGTSLLRHDKRPIVPRDVQPEEEIPLQKLTPVLPPPKKQPNSHDPTVKDFIDDRLYGANNDQNAPPYDTLFFFKYEGTGSQAGSLSSLDSSNPDEDQDYFYLNNWGPQFKKLADIYGAEDD